MSQRAMHPALTHRFTRFLHHRRALKHFGRHLLLDAIAGRGPHPAATDSLARDLLRVARDEPAATIARLKSHEGGLSRREAVARLAHSGPNEIAHEKPLPWWLHLWRYYKNPVQPAAHGARRVVVCERRRQSHGGDRRDDRLEHASALRARAARTAPPSA
jgi:hypothetical protein